MRCAGCLFLTFRGKSGLFVTGPGATVCNVLVIDLSWNNAIFSHTKYQGLINLISC